MRGDFSAKTAYCVRMASVCFAYCIRPYTRNNGLRAEKGRDVQQYGAQSTTLQAVRRVRTCTHHGAGDGACKHAPYKLGGGIA